MSGAELVRKDSIEELIGHRDRALDLYRQACRLMLDALAAHKRACVGAPYITGLHWEALRFAHMDEKNNPREEADFLKKQRVALDGDVWRALLVNTNLASLMDRDTREQFEKGLADPPAVTLDTVLATMGSLRADAGTIFRRGLVDCFRRLSGAHASNDGFRIGERMVVKGIVTVQRFGRGGELYVRMATYGEQYLRDIDRCLHVLSGRPAPQNLQGIVQAMREAIGRKEWEAETDLVLIKWHQNGNGHLRIKDPALLRDVNHEIALHYGAALPQTRGRGGAP